MLAQVGHIKVPLVQVLEHHSCTVGSRDLNLRSEFRRPRAPQELPSILEFLHLCLYFFLSCFLLVLGYKDLGRSEIFEYLILNLQHVHAKHFVQGISEVLTQVVECIEYLFLVIEQEQPLMEILAGEVGVRLFRFRVGNLKQLLEQHNDEFHHLLVLLGLLLGLEAVGHVLHEDTYDLWLQKAFLVAAERLHHGVSVSTFGVVPGHHSLFCAGHNVFTSSRKLRQLDHEPTGQERQSPILFVENQQRN